MANQSLTDKIVANLQPKDKPYELRDKLCTGLILRIEKSGNKFYWQTLWTPDSSGRRQRYRFKIGSADSYKLFSTEPKKAEDRELSVRHIARRLKVKSEKEDLRVTRKEAKAAAQADAVATLGAFMDGPYLEYCHEAGMTDPDRTVRWLKSVFSDLLYKPVDKIDYLDIRRWLKKAEKTRKASTIRRLLLGGLSSVLTYAMACDKSMQSHPLQAKERKRKTTPIKLPKVEDRKLRYLSTDEETRLRDTLTARDQRLKAKRANHIAHCEAREGMAPPAPLAGAYGDYLTPLVLLALNCGARRGALLGLRWSDIDSTEITIKPALDKSGKGYSIVQSKEAKQVLRLWKRQTQGQGDALLFPNPRSGEAIKSIKTIWGNLMTEAKLENFRFHDCRHTFASKLVMGIKGKPETAVSLYTVQKLLGHASISMTERYSHLSPDYMKDALKVLDA